jgi:ankyrin repeat protein
LRINVVQQVQCSNVDMELLLVTGKAEVDSKNNTGSNPLALAANNGYNSVVEQLLVTGKAKVDSKNKHRLYLTGASSIQRAQCSGGVVA